MICAAESGLTASITSTAITRLSHPNSGIFPSVIPGQRMQAIVAPILIAVPMLPNPETSRASIQKSGLCPREHVCDVQDAQALVIDGGHPVVKLSDERTRRYVGPKR